MTPTARLALYAVVGGVLAALLGGDFALGAAVGALLALRARDVARIAALEARLARAPGAAEPAPDQDAVDESEEAPVPEPAAPPLPEPDTVEVRPAPPRPARPRPARPPRRSPWDDLPPEVHRAWAFVTGGNAVARVGLLVLFVGIGLGIRYAVEQGVVPVEVRLAASAAVGAGLVGIGWRLRQRAEAFALALQGGGVAVLYLTVYAAYALYALVPSLVAIALMAAIAVGCAALALAQSAPGLAVLGVAGGFAAPVLAGTAEGNHILLLSYYALLNAGVLGIAWVRGWRSLAVVGFVSTFVTGGLWGGLSYRPELYASVQPFVVVNFAIYLALAVRFAVRSARVSPPERALVVDGALVFGLPAATFALQAEAIEGVVPYGRAWSAAVLALVYLATAGALWRREGVRLVADAFLAVGLAFATIALPLAFQRVVVGALWVLEGAGLVWVGIRQGKRWMWASGLALQAVAASVLFVEGVLELDRAFNAETLTGWIVAVALGLSAYVLSRPAEATAPDGPVARRPRAWVGRLFLGFALFWWTITAAVHVLDFASGSMETAALLGAAAASGALFLALGRALSWRALAAASFGVVPAAAVLVGIGFGLNQQPFAGWRGVGWLAAAAVTLVALRTEPARSHPLRRLAFVGGAWLAVAVVANALSLAAHRAPAGDGWTWGVVGAVVAMGLAFSFRVPDTWASAWERRQTTTGLAVASVVWLVLGFGISGSTAPLPYVPLLNPLDVASLAVVLVLAAAVRQPDSGRGVAALVLITLAFGALTAAVLRAVHHLGGVRWTADALFASSTAQAALAVTWTVFALVLALASRRTGSRPLWFAGAAVLALVVGKLFLVDLAQAQALVLVAAFITVGALVTLIGYLAPLPPRHESVEDAERRSP